MANKLDKCKDLVRDFIATSTWHGLPGVVTAPSRWMRVLWMIIFLIATFISLYKTAHFLDIYFGKPLETDVQVKELYLALGV